MAINNHIRIPALPSVYSRKRGLSREIDVFYSLPTEGINEDTGVVLYISGFRGHAESNSFKQFRNCVADKHNLIVLQCNYFGYEFMQRPKFFALQDEYMEQFTKEDLIKIYNNGVFNIDTFFELTEKYSLDMFLREDLSEECPENFNEMGLMQAIDNLNALLTVMSRVNEFGYKFNTKKIILYGNSQGAYLSHLCNLIAPNLFSLIIDNSGWLYPGHLGQDKRQLSSKRGQSFMKFVFDYKARDILDDFQILDLKRMYSSFDNKARIVAYHGQEDTLISLEDKMEFIQNVQNSTIYPITNENLSDYEGIFLNIKHGLGTHYSNLFSHVIEHSTFEFDKDTDFKFPENSYLETDTHRYIFKFDCDIPTIAKFKK